MLTTIVIKARDLAGIVTIHLGRYIMILGSISFWNDRRGFGATTGVCPYRIGQCANVKCTPKKGEGLEISLAPLGLCWEMGLGDKGSIWPRQILLEDLAIDS